MVVWRNVIFFPWVPDQRLFAGERIYSFFPDAEDGGMLRPRS
jgi:hypothetical protein